MTSVIVSVRYALTVPRAVSHTVPPATTHTSFSTSKRHVSTWPAEYTEHGLARYKKFMYQDQLTKMQRELSTQGLSTNETKKKVHDLEKKIIKLEDEINSLQGTHSYLGHPF